MSNYISFLLCFLCCSYGIAEQIKASHFVSFIIPSYNCEETVEQSISSIYQQNLDYPFEIVCTNDCSTDKTELVLEDCSQKYPNVVIVRHEKNKGGGAARNTCVQNSKGDLIFCLDSDNFLSPNSMNALIAVIDRTGCDIAVFNDTNVFCPYSGNNTKTTYTLSPETTILDVYSCIGNILLGPISSGNYLFTRKSYDRAGGYLEDFGAVDTVAFGVAQFATGSKMAFLEDQAYWHRHTQIGYWGRENLNNGANIMKVIAYFSELYDDESNRRLSNYLQGIAPAPSQFSPASPQILEALFKAYEYKVEKRYAEAAEAFALAIDLGCTSLKIYRYLEEMKNFSKN